jgi:hypothetical protein
MNNTQLDNQYTWFGNTVPASGNVTFSSGMNYNYNYTLNNHYSNLSILDTLDTSSLNFGNIISTGAFTTSASSYSLVKDLSTAKVQLNHDGIKMDESCDLIFGNTSFKDCLARIESRLAILRPDERLESDWEELKSLGDQYRALEKQINEKMKTWNILQRRDEDDSNKTI